jgi:type II secretory pathway predicted ATPase ExeA
MLLYGESGTGKTSIIRQFRKMHPPTDDPLEDEDTIPVLVVETPFEPKVSMLYDRILYEIGVPYKTTENVVVKENRIEFYVNKLGVKMLILDEFHNILNGSASQQRKVLSAIKSLTNTLKIPIVLAGTRDALIAVESEDEMKRRFFPKYLPKWKKDRDFALLLKSIEKTLPLKYPSYLWKDDRFST